MKPRHKRLAIAGGVVVAVGAIAALVLNAFQSNLVFFYSPTQIAAKEAPSNRTFRVGGLVQEGSVKRDGVKVNFVVTDTGNTVPVQYEGILPDLFKEGKGVVAQGQLKEGGVLVWYDAVLQPLDVRLGAARAVTAAAVEEECGRRGARAILVLREDLADPRMQNVAILAALAEHRLPPGVSREHIKAALGDLMEGAALERNLALFE